MQLSSAQCISGGERVCKNGLKPPLQSLNDQLAKWQRIWDQTFIPKELLSAQAIIHLNRETNFPDVDWRTNATNNGSLNVIGFLQPILTEPTRGDPILQVD